MTEIKQETKTLNKVDPDPLLLAEVEVRDNDPKNPHRKRSAGEVAFDRVVYTGIGFGVNEASAIVIADEFQNRSGKKLFQTISEWMVKNMKFTDTVKNGVHIPANKSAESMLLWASLLISGTALVVPMKKLEDNKEHWVTKANHWFDKRNGTVLTDEQVAARDKEVSDSLACEGKQTWASLAIGRSIAIVTALGLGKLIGPQRSEKMMDWSEKMFTGSVQVEKNRAHSYAAVAALETASCATTSVALEFASKLFAKRGVTVRNPEKCTALVHEKDNAPPASTSSGTTGGQADATGTKEKKQPGQIEPVIVKEVALPVKETKVVETAIKEKETEVKETTVKEPVTIPSELEDKHARFRKKSHAKMESHVDAAQASKEAGFSLAP